MKKKPKEKNKNGDEENPIFKCNVCGNIVELLHNDGGQLVCCGQPMELLQEKTEDEGLEKHVPVVEKTSAGTKIKVGSIPHPMEDNHFIQWIEVTTDNGTWKKFLRPNQKPEVVFKAKEKPLVVRECCNLHGLWKTTTGQ